MKNDPKRSPLIRSSAILRGIATAITLTTLSGMTAFAAGHVQNTNAPLQPTSSAAKTSATSATTTSAATTSSTSTTTSSSSRSQRRTTITSGVGTTTSAARTKTAQS